MLMNKRSIYLFLLVLLAILSQSCAQNTITSSWVDPSFKGPIKGKILVVGVFKDPAAFKIFEDSFVDSLVRSGVDAVPSHNYNQGSSRHSKGWLQQAVKQSGATTILITHLSKEKKHTENVGPRGLILGGAMYGNDVDGYHSFVVEETLEPGYMLTKTDDYIDVTLFDSQTNKAFWSVSSKSVNLNHLVRTDDEQLENLYIKHMKHDRLF